jgi:hypothetical protein
MKDDEFKDKVIDGMARIETKLENTITETMCNKKHDKLNNKINFIYWGTVVIVSTVSVLARIKGLI